MALVIAKTQNKDIKFLGSDVSVNSVYGRLHVDLSACGKIIDVQILPYESKAKYEAGAKVLDVDVPLVHHHSLTGEQVQSLSLAHDLTEAALETLGYEVTQQDL